jgi:putative spermidine/putrescine transport system permease protein
VILALALYQVVIVATRTTSLLALLIGHIVVTLPYPIRTITAVLEGLDPSLDDAAASVGATPLQTITKIILPLARSGIVAGALFAFIVSWNDFPISIFLAPPQGIPLPVRIYSYILFEYKPLIAAVSTYLILLSVVVVFSIERLVGFTVFVGRETRS